MNENKGLTLFEKFIYKFFISMFILFILVLLDYLNIVDYQSIKRSISTNINTLEIVQKVNGEINIIDLGSEKETKLTSELDGEFINDKMTVSTNNYLGVKNIISGVVTKITKTNGYYEVDILGLDNIVYTYSHLESLDKHIYNYIKTDEIIGNTSTYYEVTRMSEKKINDN